MLIIAVVSHFHGQCCIWVHQHIRHCIASTSELMVGLES